MDCQKSTNPKNILEKCNNCESNYIEISLNEEISFRPIVACPTNETHRLSNLIDIILKPMSKHVKSFIRDSTDFLNHPPTTVSPNSILASFDVESLYSNIPHELGLEVIEYRLNKHPEEIPNRINKDFIKRGLQFILKNNNFYFNGKYYNQVKGTAMGTKYAPTFATLVLGYLEEKLYDTIEEHYDSEFRQSFERMWCRFLDDCFIIMNEDIEDLKKLQHILNSLHPCLKFTLEYSQTNLPFLDILVINNEGKIETDIYLKKTDSKQYLLYSSTACQK